jgi:tRNA nucleotidyltransferase/poly(A) polymerase
MTDRKFIRQGALAVLNTLRQNGFEAYFAGGCVRDRLLGIDPVDYDIATAAHPQRIAELFPDSRLVGAVFGVVIVTDPETGTSFEVATFRHDGSYGDGRHPDLVTFADLESDVLRRDFTINGLMEDPVEGRIIDLVGGRKDLDSKILRAIGDPQQRFTEDKLRLLRAVRFAARLGFEIEPRTLQALKQMAPQIEIVSAERIRQELEKILTEGGSARGLDLLKETGLLKIVLQEIQAMVGVEQSPVYHPEGDVYRHTRKALSILDRIDTPGTDLAWAVLLHDVGKPPAYDPGLGKKAFVRHSSIGKKVSREILKRLRASNSTVDTVGEAVGKHMTFLNMERMKESTLKRFVRSDLFPLLLELFRIDSLASSGQLEVYEVAKAAYQKYVFEEPEVEPLIGGRDLIELGFTPSPLFGQILFDVEEEQLEGNLIDTEQAKKYVLQKYGHLRDDSPQ